MKMKKYLAMMMAATMSLGVWGLSASAEEGVTEVNLWVLSQEEYYQPVADAFNEAGFSLHIDDFGSGRSSLNDLNVLSIDVVKLDRSLISCIGEKRGSLLLAHTIALGRALGLKLIAEGVEDEEQLNFLKENGCDYIQGYYYSRPLPEAELEKKVSKNR